MGTPLNWKKIILSLSIIWFGFQVDPFGFIIMILWEKHLPPPPKLVRMLIIIL